MRIPSGTTDQYIYFVAVDETDLKTRETGLSSFTVYRSRDGAAAAAMTTPTINETDSANMPGVYELLLDEDMTIGPGNDTEEMVFHITHSGMAPVTRVVELFRPKITVGYTLGVESDGDLTKVNTLDGHTAQSGDGYPIVNSGTHGNAALKTLIDIVYGNVDDIIANLFDSPLPEDPVTMESKIDLILGISEKLDDTFEDDAGTYRFTANALEQGGGSLTLLDTTIATYVSATSVTLTAGADFNDAYNDQIVVIYDADNNNYPTVCKAKDYVAATKTLSFDESPAFTPASGDTVKILPGSHDMYAYYAYSRAGDIIYNLFATPLPEEPSPLQYDIEAIAEHLTDIKGATFDSETDSLEAIRGVIDTVGGVAGAGATTWTYTLTNAVGGAPIADANVWVTTDSSGNNVIASGLTDQNGRVTFYLDAGTIYVWRQKSGWNFANPDIEVVS